MEFENKDRNLIVLRGVSGSGKNFFANLIEGPKKVCCADDYFMFEGEYLFDASKLANAHRYSMIVFNEALANPKIKNIVVANTNIKSSDWKFYVDKAEEVGIKVSFAVIENRHGGENQHGVPPHVLNRHEQGIKNNLKLR